MLNVNLKQEVVKLFEPFYDQMITSFKDKIHSITITGSALTEDFDRKYSDINSILTLKEMDLKFLKRFAPLGKKFGKKRIAAPLIMFPEYVTKSLDVFPIEFLNIKLIHLTVFGEDIFKSIDINKADLRHQCERELKVKLIDLRQSYIASLGNNKILAQGFINSFSGYIPLFRGIIYLLGQNPPESNTDVISSLGELTGINTNMFMDVLKEKKERLKLSTDQVNAIFENYYSAIEKLGNLVDEIDV
ncbi:MAG: hypothetical protein JRJ39_08380 [Deltaproteobacteria bacterium]|nr:hypothetical protein [Deltaproteobacteria bacterium]MBW1846386.1 hypothetical protein [Deltaproteobacteria bacterium]MBW1983402.1 hypothetical protein [Deltaproteobacteria bacterium]MBW2364272.1 hypothetical protein [Deltaproteobacteria bacterium]